MVNRNDKNDDRGGSPRKLIILLVLFAVVISAAFLVRQRALRSGEPGPIDERLRASADESVGALSEQLQRTQSADRLPLLIRYADDASPNLRYAAVDALGSLKTPEAEAAIARAFQDNSSQVRQRAVEVLHAVARERGVAMLLAALRDEDTWVRETAAMQLMTILRDPKADTASVVPSLIAAMNLDDPVVCRTAVYVLARRAEKPWKIRVGMSREEQEQVVAKWRAWWQAERKRDPALALAAGAPLPDPIRHTRRDPAPDYRFRDIEGRTWSLAGQKGRLTLLHFWGTWCQACHVEMRDLSRIDNEYRAQGLDILGLALSEKSEAHLKQWLGENDVKFAQAMAPQPILDAYGHIHEVPVSVLIDRSGMVRYRWEGERDYATFRQAIARLLEE